MTNLSVAVVSGHDKDPEYATYTYRRMEEYCRHNGYDFKQVPTEDYYFSKTPIEHAAFFARYVAIARLLKQETYTHVLWLDADVAVMRYLSLEDALDIPDSADFYIAPDIKDFVNTGVMLFTNSDWCRKFLEEICEMAMDPSQTYPAVKGYGDVSKKLPDQHIVKTLLFDNWGNALVHTRFIDASMFNANPQYEYWGAPITSMYSARKETLFLHWAGIPDEVRLAHIKALDKIY